MFILPVNFYIEALNVFTSVARLKPIKPKMPSYEGVRGEHSRLFTIAKLSDCGICQSGPGRNRTAVRTAYPGTR